MPIEITIVTVRAITAIINDILREILIITENKSIRTATGYATIQPLQTHTPLMWYKWSLNDSHVG